jgi:hypothetical protein
MQKSHALLGGELRVLNDLPPNLTHGDVRQAQPLPVVMRLSTSAAFSCNN